MKMDVGKPNIHKTSLTKPSLGNPKGMASEQRATARHGLILLFHVSIQRAGTQGVRNTMSKMKFRPLLSLLGAHL